MTTSTRPVAASMRGVKLAPTPPCRMKVPSCTVRTRSTLGLKVIDRLSVETRDALLIETGTVYGPPPTWKTVPGTVTITCAGVAVARGSVGAGGVVASRGGAVAPGAPAPVPAGAPVPACGGAVVGSAGVPAGGAVAGGTTPAGGGCAPGCGTGVGIVGTGNVPGGAGRFVG